MRSASSSSGPQGTDAVTPGVRRFVVAFLLLVVGSSLIGVEAWPLTGWGFYSRTLSDRVQEWKVLTVDPAGAEHAIPWDRLPTAYRTTYRQLPELVTSSPAEQEQACRAWADAVRDLGERVAEVRVYWTDTQRHISGAPATQRRRLELTCARTA
ncbi:MAG: hypothetical protein H0U89_05160 [Acidimicrobiia bacterium]|nr:hypothetical protein [Acidimicrobiia bacterium]